MKNKKISNKIFLTLGILLVIVGIFVFMFPKITNYMYDSDVAKQEEQFDENSADNSYDGLYKELQRRNEELYATAQQKLEDPFSYETDDIDLTKYGIKDNTLGFVYIPKMDVKLPIVLGANSDNLLKGAAHMTNTSYPIGGENTNCVLAAHRGWNRAKMFRHIELLEVGDKVYIKNFRETITYKVSQIEIIYPTEIDKLKIQSGKDMLTLITCHPYRVNTRRYVVYCERITDE